MTWDHYDDSSDNDDLSLLSELLSFTKQKNIFIAAKSSSEIKDEKIIDHIIDEYSASSCETRVGDSQD